MNHRLPPHVLTTGDVARGLCVSTPTASKWIDAGLIEGWKIPGSLDRRTTMASVVEFANRHGIPLDEIICDRAAHLDSQGAPKPRGLRSGHWQTVARLHLTEHPACEACGAKKLVVVHHKQPFHIAPELELDPSNLISLCESPSHNCHLIFGHLLSWRSWNVDVVHDAKLYRMKVANRPTPSDQPPAAHAALDAHETRRAA